MKPVPSLFLPLAFVLAVAVLAPDSTAHAQTPCGVACDADSDGDGVDDRDDECVDSLAGMPAVSRGCAAGELITQPELLLRTVRPAFAKADGALDNPSLWGSMDGRAQGLRRGIAGASRVIEKGVTRISQGRVCAGAKLVTRGAAKMEKLSVRSGDLVTMVREELVASVDPGAGDADTDEIRFHEVGYRGGLVGKALVETRTLDQRTSLLCSTVVESRIKKSGRVIALNDASGMFTLDDGTRVLMASKKGRPPVQVGLTVDFTASRLADGTLLMLDGGRYTAEIADITPGAFSIRCTDLRLAPIQPFPPLAAPEGPYVLHDPDGYRLWDGRLIVEYSMRVGAASRGCATTGDTPFPGSSYRYSLKVEAKRSVNWELVASDLEPGDVPVAIPFGTSKLRITEQVQACTGSLFNRTCTRPSAIGTPYEEELLAFADRKFGTFGLSQDAFDLANAQPWEFEVASMGAASLTAGNLLDGLTLSTEARGYSSSGSKAVVTVNGANPDFAMYREDDFGGDGVLLAEQRFGVKKPAGLAWPRLVGDRDGKPFWYLLDVPDVQRDAVADCGSGPDTYHKLPWTAGTVYSLWQGNNGAFSHGGSQAFAFDFGTPDGTTLRASRAGVVDWVQESLTATFDPNSPVSSTNQPFPGGSAANFGNVVRIGHDDGTWSWYFHLQENGALVEAGDRVERGQPIALSGDTGRSTGPHLHFQVQGDNVNWGQSIQVNISSANYDACRVPQTGDDLESDNANPNFP